MLWVEGQISSYFFSGEDIDAYHVNLSVTVLASLGGRSLHDLAGAALHYSIAVLLDRRALHGNRGGCSRAHRLEGLDLLLLNFNLIVRHGC